ncbi:hypothetical protein BKA70DRAFT_1568111 [Coprinopsis sp. MPI-PUGE-AT-0042]|nr:hypothetical protein BKA70DRAFT_1568111 [Coprinopsis sp. MPI-PUGE-AT-0042]
MTLKLSLTSKSRPWDTVYYTQDGQPLYRARRRDLSTTYGNDTLKLSKIAPSSQHDHKEIASIRLRAQSDAITINGVTVSDKDFFTKKAGSTLYGCLDRVWNGPDGQEYRWVIRGSKPELYRNDASETLVAKFHREHSSWFRNKTPASIEIFLDPTNGLSVELLDMIVMTFIYVDIKRVDLGNATATGVMESTVYPVDA